MNRLWTSGVRIEPSGNPFGYMIIIDPENRDGTMKRKECVCLYYFLATEMFPKSKEKGGFQCPK